jgi:hypothetical protein
VFREFQRKPPHCVFAGAFRHPGHGSRQKLLTDRRKRSLCINSGKKRVPKMEGSTRVVNDKNGASACRATKACRLQTSNILATKFLKCEIQYTDATTSFVCLICLHRAHRHSDMQDSMRDSTRALPPQVPRLHAAAQDARESGG